MQKKPSPALHFPGPGKNLFIRVLTVPGNSKPYPPPESYPPPSCLGSAGELRLAELTYFFYDSP